MSSCSDDEMDLAAVRSAVHDDRAELVLRGRVDVSEARTLHEHALALAGSGMPVTVDCAGVERVDGAALQVLLALHAALAARGVAMSLVHVPSAVDATLRLAGVHHVFAAPPAVSASEVRP